MYGIEKGGMGFKGVVFEEEGLFCLVGFFGRYQLL